MLNEVLVSASSTKKKHQKRKDPRTVQNSRRIGVQVKDVNDDSGNDEVSPAIVIDDKPNDIEERETIQIPDTNHDGLFIDLTEGQADGDLLDMSMEIMDKGDLIVDENPTDLSEICADVEMELVPDQIYWESILAAIEHCTSSLEMISVVEELQINLKPLRRRTSNIYFNPVTDYIDATARELITSDGPMNVDPIWTCGDGNCMCRSLSKAYCGSDDMHI